MNRIPLKYTGKLILQTKTRTAVKYNHGTKNLFRLLSTILCKESFNTLSLPPYFMLYRSDIEDLVNNPYTDVNIDKQILRNYVDVISQSSSSEDIFESTFSSMFDSSMLIGSVSEADQNNLVLGLISGDKRSILAVVEFDADTFRLVENGGQTFIRWIMTISNVDEIE